MPESEDGPELVGRRKAYKAPKLTKLTPEAAKKMLETKAKPGDKQAKKLMDAINRRLSEDADAKE